MITDVRPWSVPVRLEDVPETGHHLTLVADEQTRLALSAAAGVNAVTRLEAEFDLLPQGKDGLHVEGAISATVRQTCVVTLEPIINEVNEAVDITFAPEHARIEGRQRLSVEEDPPERLVGGRVDLGALATEFLILGVDRYPRKPGVVFEGPCESEARATAFSALSALKK